MWEVGKAGVVGRPRRRLGGRDTGLSCRRAQGGGEGWGWSHRKGAGLEGTPEGRVAGGWGGGCVCAYIYSHMIYFKELTHTIVGAGNSFSAGQASRNSGKC